MKHTNIFTSLRLLFASLVIVSHSYAFLGLAEPIIFGRTLGNFAVHGFFVLSGYLIAMSLQRSTDALYFISSRFFRILPGLLVALIMSFLAFKAFNGYSQNAIPQILNGPIWTLPWEVVCYFLLFGVTKWTKSIGIAVSWPGLWAVLFLLYILNSQNTDNFYQVIAPMMLMFFSGAAISAIGSERIFSNKGPVLFASIGLITCLFPGALNAVLEFQQVWFPLAWGPSLDVGIVQRIIYIAALPIVLIKIGELKIRILSGTFDVSYGLYLYGWPVGQSILALRMIDTSVLAPASLASFTLLIAGLIATASWVCIERPSMKLKNLLNSRVNRFKLP